MNIDKAIKSNQELISQPWLQPFPEYIASVEMGIEALKRITAWRNDNNEDLLWDLPGETED